jgi:homoserine acetyltransferase
MARVHEALLGCGITSKHLEISTPNGHDAFLVDYHLITPIVREFLAAS